MTVKLYSKTEQKYFKAKPFQPSNYSFPAKLCSELQPTRPRCLSIKDRAAIIQERSDSGIAFWRKTYFILESQTLVSPVMLKRANERFLCVCKTSRHQPTLEAGSKPQSDLKDDGLNTGKMFRDPLQVWHQQRSPLTPRHLNTTTHCHAARVLKLVVIMLLWGC